jgi:hypothetical protein
VPATVSGNPRSFYPDADIGFRFDDAAFLPLPLADKDRLVDEASRRVKQYFKFQDPDDAGEPDAPTIWLPDMRELAINTSTEFNRNYGSPEPYFTIKLRFVDDPSQTTGIPRGQVKARAEVIGNDIVAEIAALESEESLPITATITWL